MDIQHIKVQYNRLKRHHDRALEDKDPISFLDLANALRIWVYMKNAVDALAMEKGVSLQFKNPVVQKHVKEVLTGAKHMYLPLGSGVESPGVEIKGATVIGKALAPEEVKKLYEAGLPSTKTTALSFSEWLGSGVYETSSEDKKHPRLKISREILVKRVANILGASHPAGTEKSDETENRFDPYILELHQLEVAGYPATYYQLLEIAGDIVRGAKVLFD